MSVNGVLVKRRDCWVHCGVRVRFSKRFPGGWALGFQGFV